LRKMQRFRLGLLKIGGCSRTASAILKSICASSERPCYEDKEYQGAFAKSTCSNKRRGRNSGSLPPVSSSLHYEMPSCRLRWVHQLSLARGFTVRNRYRRNIDCTFGVVEKSCCRSITTMCITHCRRTTMRHMRHNNKKPGETITSYKMTIDIK